MEIEILTFKLKYCEKDFFKHFSSWDIYGIL